MSSRLSSHCELPRLLSFVSSTHLFESPAAFEVRLLAEDPSDPLPERKFRIIPGTPFVIGRSSKSLHKGLLPASDNAYIDCPVVSREHAYLDNASGEDAIFITDHSTHGTTVNGLPLQRSTRYKLHNGDKLRLGVDIVRDKGMCQLQHVASHDQTDPTDTFVAPEYRFNATPVQPEPERGRSPEDVCFPNGIGFPSQASSPAHDWDGSCSENDVLFDESHDEYTSDGSPAYTGNALGEAVSVGSDSMDDSASDPGLGSTSDGELEDLGEELPDSSETQNDIRQWFNPLDIPIGRENEATASSRDAEPAQEAAQNTTQQTAQENRAEASRDSLQGVSGTPVYGYSNIFAPGQQALSQRPEGFPISGSTPAPAGGLPISTQMYGFTAVQPHPTTYSTATHWYMRGVMGTHDIPLYRAPALHQSTAQRGDDTLEWDANQTSLPSVCNDGPTPSTFSQTSRTKVSIPELMTASHETQAPAVSPLRNYPFDVAERTNQSAMENQASPQSADKSSQPFTFTGSRAAECPTDVAELVSTVVQPPSSNCALSGLASMQPTVEVQRDEKSNETKVAEKNTDEEEVGRTEVAASSSIALTSARPPKRKAEELAEKDLVNSKRMRRVAVPRRYNKLRKGVKFTGILATGMAIGAAGVVGLLTTLPEAFFQ
ncbi:uncharacterized protein EI97DRAFT_442348 [Westerdykella ornata]|uniref:FHA domain-containing protein n=1 Tax=Westerdykella ornata TaxID=318751 RepID=A0A6A6JIW7_WESOR|nr:uncharacterized protein EI97DRAFT_442348 [Westerdykella ornata]KAF2276392.1 hypothetical protein EI97DRAFT_442348 [Westerdykella ornata]